MPRAISSGWSRWTRRSTELISTAPTRRVLTSPQGATANHNNLSPEEPDRHAIRCPRRAPEPARTRPPRRVLASPQGATANHDDRSPEEPGGHAIGRSRGGLGRRSHAAVDGNGMPLALVLTGGQRHDGAMLLEVLD